MAEISQVARFRDRGAALLMGIAPPAGPPQVDELEATVVAAADWYQLIVRVPVRTPSEEDLWTPALR